jgi:putative flippase GtrA
MTGTRVRRSLSAQGALIRFLIVGSASSLIYATLAAALVGYAEVPAWLVSVVLYTVMIPIAFSFQKRFAFRGSHASYRGFLLYGALQIASIVLVSAFTTAFVTGTYLVDVLIFLVTSGASAAVSFLLCRAVIFTPPGAGER